MRLTENRITLTECDPFQKEFWILFLRVIVDLDGLAPSAEACLRNVQSELASPVVVPKMATQLDVLKSVNAVGEEAGNAQGASNDRKRVRRGVLIDCRCGWRRRGLMLLCG